MMIPIAVLIISIITVLMGLIFVFLLYRAIRGLVRFAIRHVRAGSEQIIIQSVAFAVALLFFPEVAQYALKAITQVLNTVFVQLPPELSPKSVPSLTDAPRT